MINSIVEIKKGKCNCIACLITGNFEPFSIMAKNKKESVFAAKLHYDIITEKIPNDLKEN
jgi:hypothetical protein